MAKSLTGSKGSAEGATAALLAERASRNPLPHFCGSDKAFTLGTDNSKKEKFLLST